MTQHQDIARDETPSLIAADKVKGTNVYNSEGEKLGSIESVILERRSGRVAYAVMSFGGFLGMGERYHPLPWAVLSYDSTKGGYVVPLSKEQLRVAPTYAMKETPNWEHEAWNEEVHRYYNVDPSWPK